MMKGKSTLLLQAENCEHPTTENNFAKQSI